MRYKPPLLNDRLGTIRKNRFGSLMEIIEYKNAKDVQVKFLEFGNIVHTNWRHFSEGNVRNPYDKSVCNIGYIGEGKHKVSENNKGTHKYKVWRSMIVRSYSETYHKNQPTYLMCSVADEWHNFQNFGDWYDRNYYQIEGQRMDLDKDILFKRNKIYSPLTCVFVPHNINALFTKRESERGNLPIGVMRKKEDKKYYAAVGNGNGKHVYLGYFDDSQMAFLAYKTAKENLIKQTAIEYRTKIPTRLYDALMNYEVESTD